MEIFSCSNLSFSFGKKNIFNNSNFNIQEGDVVALVGENGVGKSTLLKLITGIYYSPKISKKSNIKITYKLDNNPFYEKLSIQENLNYYCITNGENKEKINKYLELLNIKQYANTKISKCSYGTKQKAEIARCLLFNSDVYIFDEPFNGLDPISINLFMNIIKLLKKDHKTIIISSHNINELGKYCNILLIIYNNTIFQKNFKEKIFSIECNKIPNDLEQYNENNKLIIHGQKSLNEILKILIEKKADIKSINDISSDINYYLEKGGYYD